MATTTNFGWSTPDNTGYVKDGALSIRTLGTAIDASMAPLRGGTTDQVLKKASGSNMDFVWGTVSSTPRIGQVVQATTTTTTATSSSTYVDATNMNATITPTLSTSKILVSMTFMAGFSTSTLSSLPDISTQILRGSTAIYDIGQMYLWVNSAIYGAKHTKITVRYLDSPATTSATTYKLQVKKANGIDATINNSGTATIILEEVLV